MKKFPVWKIKNPSIIENFNCFYLGEEFIDEDDIDYGEESEEISDVDDEELLKRLEAKYGKISDKSSEDNDWTSNYAKKLISRFRFLIFNSFFGVFKFLINFLSHLEIPREEEGGAQSYMDELLKQQTLEEVKFYYNSLILVTKMIFVNFHHSFRIIKSKNFSPPCFQPPSSLSYIALRCCYNYYSIFEFSVKFCCVLWN